MTVNGTGMALTGRSNDAGNYHAGNPSIYSNRIRPIAAAASAAASEAASPIIEHVPAIIVHFGNETTIHLNRQGNEQ